MKVNFKLTDMVAEGVVIGVECKYERGRRKVN
jgi:hypothetical protein